MFTFHQISKNFCLLTGKCSEHALICLFFHLVYGLRRIPMKYHTILKPFRQFSEQPIPLLYMVTLNNCQFPLSTIEVAAYTEGNPLSLTWLKLPFLRFLFWICLLWSFLICWWLCSRCLRTYWLLTFSCCARSRWTVCIICMEAIVGMIRCQEIFCYLKGN